MSYVFYGWWRPDFMILMFVSTLIDYACGKLIARTDNPARRKIPLVFSIVCNLGLLSYFKYANFVVGNLNTVLGWAGRPPIFWESVILPIGISFYTFQTMSYVIDVYRRDAEPARTFFDFACFVSLFPHLIAGPIIRYHTLAEQFQHRSYSLEKFSLGVFLFMIGFAKKILLANNVAEIADRSFARPAAGFSSAWIGLFAYTFQIYFDFSGYSDMAIGLGLMFGFTIPKNFDLPYSSRSITEFWRRWHISLSTFLRDYLYIPMGGNRKGRRKTYMFLLLTMLLGGLWHGAQWTFVIWGAYHGLLLAAERMRGKQNLYHFLPAPLQIFATLLLVMIGWALFRAPSLAIAGSFIRSLTGFHGLGRDPLQMDVDPMAFLALGACLIITAFPQHSVGTQSRPMAPGRIAACTVFVFSILLMFFQRFNPFLYYQF